MSELQKFYTEWLGIENFYAILKSYINTNSNDFLVSDNFLSDINIVNKQRRQILETKLNDIRIDVPVWFGDINMAKIKLMVFGLEPRDTDLKFNVERIENKVYGAPFGIDRWNINSSIPRKPQNKYFRVFNDVINNGDIFILFSDVVKHFNLKNENKLQNDNNARKFFFNKAEIEREKLVEEINKVLPDYIITLGNDSYKVVSSILNDKIKIINLRHPAQGGESIAKMQLDNFIETLLK